MLEFNHVSFNYGRRAHKVEIIRDIHLDITSPSFILFLGPSGCGKSTLLKLIAGLLPPSQGEIRFEDKKITGPSQDRGIVFQQFSLFPWLTVKENIEFPLNLSYVTTTTKHKLVQHYLDATGLKNCADLYPIDLSGGMQQRTAIARTLASDPKILLMDEPFSSLDFQIRLQLQRLITEIFEIRKKTIIFVTHDIEEALLLADKIVILSRKPAGIKTIYDVPFARPRDLNLRYTTEFSQLVRKLQNSFIDVE